MSVNQCNFTGNLGADPKKIETKSGKDMVKLNLAISVGYKENKQTIWMAVLCFDHNAKFAQQYLKKGDKIFTSGQLNPAQGKTKSGEEYNSVSLIAREISKLSMPSKQENNTGENYTSFDEDIPF